MDFGFSAVCSEPRTEDFPVPVPNGTEGVRFGIGPYCILLYCISIVPCCFFKSGGTIYKFHLLQKCMKLNKWFIPFFRSFCLNWWKTRSNTLMASNFGNNKLSLFVSWASFDVCMDIPLGETLFLKNIYLRMTWSK